MKKMSAIILTSMLLFSCAVLAQQKKVMLLIKHGVLFESDKHS
jgi:hypothetical protein